MRLINFGVGEITDRLSILALKILHGDKGETAHFTNERAALLAKLSGRNLNGVWFEQALELGAVNATIWRLEDDLRVQRSLSRSKQDDPTIVVIACRLQELNDRRHELIAEINKKAGEFFGSEKGFQPLPEIDGETYTVRLVPKEEVSK